MAKTQLGNSLLASMIATILLFSSIVTGPSRAEENAQQEVHSVLLANPALPGAAERSYNVVLSKDANRFPCEYSLTFETPVCMGNQCRPIEVTMTWSATGRFKRLSHPPGKPLTKNEHEPFTQADYKRLDGILKISDSVLAKWNPAAETHPQIAGSDIDAVSRPTPITAKGSVVPGAAYTTWALWQWANGPIVHKLLAITEKYCTAEYLNHLLVRQDSAEETDFALARVIEHHSGDPRFVESAYHVLEHGGRNQIRASLTFLTSAVNDRETLNARLIESCSRIRPTDIPIILEQFADQPELSAATLEGLTGKLGQFPYYPVHLILNMLEKRKLSSPKTIADVTGLLESDNFFIARRAYEHLTSLNLDTETKRKVEAFRARHSDRL